MHLWNRFRNYFDLKEESIGTPEICLGGIIFNIGLENSVKACVFGSNQYFKAAVENVEGYLK